MQDDPERRPKRRPAAAAPAMPDAPAGRPDLPAEARRALAEAEARRRMSAQKPAPAELGGRKGPDPVRYGDWEKKGIAVDF